MREGDRANTIKLRFTAPNSMARKHSNMVVILKISVLHPTHLRPFKIDDHKNWVLTLNSFVRATREGETSVTCWHGMNSKLQCVFKNNSFPCY